MSELDELKLYKLALECATAEIDLKAKLARYVSVQAAIESVSNTLETLCENIHDRISGEFKLNDNQENILNAHLQEAFNDTIEDVHLNSVLVEEVMSSRGNSEIAKKIISNTLHI